MKWAYVAAVQPLRGVGADQRGRTAIDGFQLSDDPPVGARCFRIARHSGDNLGSSCSPTHRTKIPLCSIRGPYTAGTYSGVTEFRLIRPRKDTYTGNMKMLKKNAKAAY